MNAISLWQPWASLWILGIKYFETRGYPFPRSLRGQTVAVHAAKKRVDLEEGARISMDWLLRQKGTSLDALPYGSLLGVVELRAAFQIGDRIPETPRAVWDIETLCKARCPAAVEHRIEDLLGDFRLRRWAWEPTNRRVLSTPIPYRGQQGFFPINPATLSEITRQLTTPEGAK